MVKISLIIPVYNVEKYLEKCLNSCVDQDIPIDEYEIIIVNDGTKDNSLNIANEFKQKYQNIKVYSQNNHGLSAARNKGLSLAKGEYVWFIDSDDWIEINCLKRITNKCFDEKLDALAIRSANIINGNPVIKHEFKNLSISQGRDAMLDVEFNVCAPFTIYRRKFLIENSLNFYFGIFHEDSEFSPRAYYFADRISRINDLFYFVNYNPTSITRTINPKKSYDLIKVCNSLSEFSKIILPKYKYKFNNLISMYLNNSLYNSYYMTKKDIEVLNVNISKNRHLFRHLINSSVTKYRLEGFLFKLFPHKTVQIYKYIQYFNKQQKVSLDL